MNPLTQVKNIQKITERETAAGISEDASWHAEYKDSAYIFFGGLSYELTEGDVLSIFAQYGEIVDVNLIRDKATGKSKGYGFLAYEDRRSTILAVDNLNGATVASRTIRVDHVRKYRKKEEEDEGEWQRKREENGVCFNFQRGQCNRGDSCKFSHDESRHKDTGWGPRDESKWKHDRQDPQGRKRSREYDEESRRDGRVDNRYSDRKSRDVDRDRREHSDRKSSRDRRSDREYSDRNLDKEKIRDDRGYKRKDDDSRDR